MSLHAQDTSAIPPPALEGRSIQAGYGSEPVVRDVDIVVHQGEVVVLLGPNGAGKTTTLRALAGAIDLQAGTVLREGLAVRTALDKRARAGMALVTEERSVFPSLTVEQNLRVGRCNVDRALELFPELAGRLKVPAGLISGGEQQMLTLGRALARAPSLLLADELSLGLAPKIVERLLTAVRSAADSGIAVLLVEQHVRRALETADRGYVLARGRVQAEGTASQLRSQVEDIERSYLALSDAPNGKG
ncbi:ABC transporter ATP-binding protein [Candidatus Poriferisocius sp.]|uniref:ABC transporter ATP-binding protein n=1 Tax=Candidatus Poriferisocius sp. TaxID=3101276 RepID=UPI003B010CAF